MSATRTPAETRIKRELRFQPEGADDGTLPRTFRLDAFDSPQQADKRRAGGWVSTGPAVRSVLAEGLTRREMVALIEGAADWLAWDGRND